MKTLRHTLTTVGLALTTLLTPALTTGCQDDPLFSAPGYDGETATRTEVTNPGALRKEGDYWYASKRVPLVGVGRVVNTIMQSTIDIGGGGIAYGNLIDTNLDNYAEISNGVGIDLLGNGICSVKDLYRTYAPQQEVGFVIGNTSGGSLLDGKLLQFMVITLYNDGNQVATYNASKNSGLLSAGVLTSSNNALQTVAVKANVAFDEVMLSVSGVNINVDWAGIKVYYAFVGNTPMEYVTTDNYDKANLSNTENIGVWPNYANPILDPDHESGVLLSMILDSEFTPHKTTLNYGTTISKGTEVGFTYNEFSLLGADVVPRITLTPYLGDKEITNDIYEQNGLLGLGVIKAGNGSYGTLLHSDIDKLTFNFTVGFSFNPIGGSRLMRAYIREATKIDLTSYFTTPEKVETTSSSYVFMKPEKGEVTDAHVDGFGGAVLNKKDGRWILTGMTEGATYTVTLTYTLEDKQFVSTCQVTRVAGPEKDCTTTYLTKDNGCSIPEANDMGGVIIINWMDNAENIINPDPNTYASKGSTVSLLQVGTIAAVKSSETITPAGKYRVGFTISGGPGLLGLNALKFFMIDLYKDGVKIDQSVSASNNLISLGLVELGGEKMRVSIETEQAFDCVALRTVTVLSALDNFRIYNAFYEDASCEENSVMDECSQLMTPALNNLQIDYAHTGFEGITALARIPDLGNILDESDETGATPGSLANVGTFKLGFKFNELKANSWIGLLMRKPDGLATVELLKNIKIQFAMVDENGSVTNSETMEQNNGLLGVELIGFDEKTYIEAYPNIDFNAMWITIGGITVAEDYEFFGLYTTKDLNGNGTVDCEEQPGTDQSKGFVSMATDKEDLCDADGQGEAFNINVALNGTIDTEATYYLVCYPAEGAGTQKVIPVKINTTSSPYKLEAIEQENPLSLPAGIYTLVLYDMDITTEALPDGETESDHRVSLSSVYLNVHPGISTWKGEASSNWNDWSNWSDGSPWTCTDVIIPGGCPNYPILTQDDWKAGQNQCARIHIKDGGQLVNTFYLNDYESAWVDINLQGGRYYLLSSPLKGMISGDWFISPNEATDNPFPTLDETNYPEKRTQPFIYQRLWNTSAPVKTPGSNGSYADGMVLPDETQWTPPYNALTQAYSLGMGFSLMAGKEENTTRYTFRFPKTHDTYHYYNLAGQPNGATETVHQGETAISGRFIYEDVWETDEQLTVTLSNQTASAYYLAGNPFMAHIDLTTFMQVNGINEVKVWNGTTNNSLVLADGELLSANGTEVRYIKPMEAFFVVDGTAGTSKAITYDAHMLSPGDSRARAATRSAAPSRPGTALRLAATRDGHTAHALLRVSHGASADVVPGEDTQLLVEGEARPAVAVYTVAGGRALDIQQVPEGPAVIPLGFYLPDGGKADIRLTLDFTDPQWTDWFLVDRRTGQRQRITHTTITLRGVESGSGQYALMKNEE